MVKNGYQIAKELDKLDKISESLDEAIYNITHNVDDPDSKYVVEKLREYNRKIIEKGDKLHICLIKCKVDIDE